MKSKREKIIVIATGLAIGALLLDRVLVTPLFGRLSEADTRREEASRELIRADGLFQNKLKAMRVWKSAAGDTLQADAPQAESQLLNHVRAWAQQSGVNLTSLKPERFDQEHGFGQLTVRAAATGGMESLSRFLFLVEQSQIPVRVIDVTLASRTDGEDELTLQVGLATIYEPPVDPAQQESGR